MGAADAQAPGVLEEYRLVDRFLVPFHAIDMLGHVNHVQYVRWAETARARYFSEVIKSEIDGRRGGILAKIVVDYERQLEYRDPVAVGCRTSRIGNKSFDVIHEIWNEGTQERAAVIVATMVAYDYAARASIVVPADWRERIAAFEAAPVA